MRKNMLILSLIVSFSLFTNAQDCDFYFPQTEGAELGYTHLDKKGQIQSSSKQKVTKLNSTSDQVSAEIEVEAFDKDGNSLGENTLVVECKEGVFYIDMQNFVSSQMTESFQNMEMKMESENLPFPSNLKAGDVLDPGWIKIEIRNNGMKIMTIAVDITNRKVEAKETITTEAGTFECLKISQTVTTKAPMKFTTNSTEWYSLNKGLIKSESYSKNGKLAGSTVLTSISE